MHSRELLHHLCLRFRFTSPTHSPNHLILSPFLLYEGIGEDADKSFVKGMARAGRGTAVFICNRAELETGVMLQLSRALRPGWSNIKISWNPYKKEEDCPPTKKEDAIEGLEGPLEDSIPQRFMCSITHAIMEDPVLTQCGHM